MIKVPVLLLLFIRLSQGIIVITIIIYYLSMMHFQFKKSPKEQKNRGGSFLD